MRERAGWIPHDATSGCRVADVVSPRGLQRMAFKTAAHVLASEAVARAEPVPRAYGAPAHHRDMNSYAGSVMGDVSASRSRVEGIAGYRRCRGRDYHRTAASVCRGHGLRHAPALALAWYGRLNGELSAGYEQVPQQHRGKSFLLCCRVRRARHRERNDDSYAYMYLNSICRPAICWPAVSCACSVSLVNDRRRRWKFLP